MDGTVGKIINKPIGMYFVRLRVENPILLGSPILDLSLSVIEATGLVNGFGDISNSVTPEAPSVHIPQVTGEVFQTGFGGNTLLVHLTGEYIASVRPPAIGTYQGPFSAAFAVERDWNGTGSFAFGRYQVTHCKVANLGEDARKAPVAAAERVTA